MTRYSPRTGQPMEYQVGPFDTAHVLIQWGGSLPGNEQWTCSLRCAEDVHVPGANTVPSQSAVDSWCHGAIKDAVLAYHQRATTKLYPEVRLNYVKANRIDVDGHYMDEGTTEHLFAAVSGGGSGFAAQFPNQVALAVSLTTGFTRGPAHRGRFFLPLPAVALDAFNEMTSTDADDVKASTKTFLEAIADVPLIDAINSLTPSVMSRKAGAPAHRRITGVSVGRVLDTQRRRRRSLLEGYRNATLEL